MLFVKSLHNGCLIQLRTYLLYLLAFHLEGPRVNSVLQCLPPQLLHHEEGLHIHSKCADHIPRTCKHAGPLRMLLFTNGPLLLLLLALLLLLLLLPVWLST